MIVYINILNFSRCAPKHDEWKAKMDTCMNITEVIIAKQRNGPIGMRRLTFLGKHTRFENFMPMNSYTDDPGFVPGGPDA